jgi:hypothetical protein
MLRPTGLILVGVPWLLMVTLSVVVGMVLRSFFWFFEVVKFAVVGFFVMVNVCFCAVELPLSRQDVSVVAWFCNSSLFGIMVGFWIISFFNMWLLANFFLFMLLASVFWVKSDAIYTERFPLQEVPFFT